MTWTFPRFAPSFANAIDKYLNSQTAWTVLSKPFFISRIIAIKHAKTTKYSFTNIVFYSMLNFYGKGVGYGKKNRDNER